MWHYCYYNRTVHGYGIKMPEYKAVRITEEELVKYARQREKLNSDWEDINLKDQPTEAVIYFRKGNKIITDDRNQESE